MNKQHTPEKVLLSALLTLSNIAVLPDWHDEFYPVLHTLYNIVDSGSPQVKLQILKLLVNLSANEDMVPSLLAAEVSGSICYRLLKLLYSDWMGICCPEEPLCLLAPFVISIIRNYSFIHSIGMCRMQQFHAILRSSFRSSLLCNFSCHPSSPTVLPSSLTSSCHLFLGLTLNLVVPKFIFIH